MADTYMEIKGSHVKKNHSAVCSVGSLRVQS